MFPIFRGPELRSNRPGGALRILAACFRKFGMETYKTPERERVRAKAKRDAIKVAGGEEWEKRLAYEREARRKYRESHPKEIRAERKRWDKARRKDIPGYHKRNLVAMARRRGRERGLEATIRVSDLVWPTHCPVLGIPLHYPERGVARKIGGHNPNYPSLDRFDPSKGYVPGNVFVISFRANTIKNNATYEEMLRVARYLSRKPRCVAAMDNALQTCLHDATDELS
jgi:hypothetical protein